MRIVVSPTFIAAALGLALASSAAEAVVCYTVLDRSENVIYRDAIAPVDLSDSGAAARDRMRQRGEHMMWLDTDLCPAVVFFTGNSGSSTLSVDQVISGFPALGGRNGPAPAAGAGPAAAPAAPAANPASRPPAGAAYGK